MFINITKINLPEILVKILNDLKNLGVKPILVGGCVRDFFLNKQNKDFDIEIFDLNSLENITPLLEKFGNVNSVGKSFGVLKLKTKELEFDFSLPRTEEKIGNTHKDFLVKTNSKLSFLEAARRRDFTINAIYYDYFSNSFIDPFSGIEDLKKRKIKHIDDNTFIEDSLRVYRAIGFASRFDFEIDDKTKELCFKIINTDELKYLPKERVFEELKKLFLKSQNPSIGLKLFDYFKIFSINFQEFYKAVDNLAKDFQDKNIEDFRKLYLFFTVFLKNRDENEILNFLKNITNDRKFCENILLLSKNFTSLDEKKLKRLSLILNLEDLILVEKALNKDNILEVQNLAKSLDIFDKPLKIFVQGKDLINLNFKQSKEFKEILEFSLDLQIDFNLKKDEILEKILKKYKKF